MEFLWPENKIRCGSDDEHRTAEDQDSADPNRASSAEPKESVRILPPPPFEPIDDAFKH
jgi:hypothetical protein